jgi:TetR/AcrR family transcriptional regulator
LATLALLHAAPAARLKPIASPHLRPLDGLRRQCKLDVFEVRGFMAKPTAAPTPKARAKAVSAKAVAARRPAARRRGEGKQQILNASLAMFARFGFDGVSTADIAKRAGTSQSVVLYHFQTKDELWRAAMRLLFETVGINPRFEEGAYKDLDPVSRLRVLLRSFVLTSARHPELGRVIFWEGSTGGDRLNWLMEELARPNYAVFDAIFSEGVRQGALKSYPVTMLTLMAHGAAATIFNLSAISSSLTGQDPFDPQFVTHQADMVVDVLLTGLLRPADK